MLIVFFSYQADIDRQQIGALVLGLLLLIESAALLSLALCRICIDTAKRDLAESERRILATINLHSTR